MITVANKQIPIISAFEFNTVVRARKLRNPITAFEAPTNKNDLTLKYRLMCSNIASTARVHSLSKTFLSKNTINIYD